MRILSLCDYTGNMLKPWAEAGHDCTAVDIAYELDELGMVDGIRRVNADVLFLRSRLEEGRKYDWIFAQTTQ